MSDDSLSPPSFTVLPKEGYVLVRDLAAWMGVSTTSLKTRLRRYYPDSIFQIGRNISFVDLEKLWK